MSEGKLNRSLSFVSGTYRPLKIESPIFVFWDSRMPGRRWDWAWDVEWKGQCSRRVGVREQKACLRMGTPPHGRASAWARLRSFAQSARSPRLFVFVSIAIFAVLCLPLLVSFSLWTDNEWYEWYDLLTFKFFFPLLTDILNCLNKCLFRSLSIWINLRAHFKL